LTTSETHRAPEAFAHCEAIGDTATRDLVRHGLIVTMALLTRLSPDEVSRVVLDVELLAELLEDIMADHEDLLRSIRGTTAARLALDVPVALAERDRLATHGPAALAHAQSITDPIVRGLVVRALAKSLGWMTSPATQGRPFAAPIDLLFYTQIFETIFERTHVIESMASGKGDVPWLEDI
jgi:hypothetical protein